jgi:hypothetical protein
LALFAPCPEDRIVLRDPLSLLPEPGYQAKCHFAKEIVIIRRYQRACCRPDLAGARMQRWSTRTHHVGSFSTCAYEAERCHSPFYSHLLNSACSELINCSGVQIQNSTTQTSGEAASGKMEYGISGEGPHLVSTTTSLSPNR